MISPLRLNALNTFQPPLNRPVRFKGSDAPASADGAKGLDVQSGISPTSSPTQSLSHVDLRHVDLRHVDLQGIYQKLKEIETDLSGMNPEVVAVLQKLLPRCKYGMDIDGIFQTHSGQVLAGKTQENPFEIDLSDYPKAMLNGFDSPIIRDGFPKPDGLMTDQPVKGLCHELAFAVAKQIEALPNQPYQLEMVRVSSPRYFHRYSGMNHWAILISHPSKPEKQWLVDPSFGYAKSLLQSNRDGYSVHGSYTLLHYETCRALEGHPMMLKRNAISLMPLGFVRDLFDLSGFQQHWETAMAYLSFLPTGKAPNLEMSIKVIGQADGDEMIEPELNLESRLAPKPVLKRLLDHLRHQFGPKSPQSSES
jgi:hypothetical protein